MGAGQGDVEAIVRAGRQARGRRRALTATLCAAAVVAVATVAALTVPGTHRGAVRAPVATEPSTTTDALPSDSRPLGFSGLVVGVPDRWLVASGPLCVTPRRPFVAFVTGAVYNCPRISNEQPVPVSSLGVGSLSAMHLPRSGWTSTTSRSGVTYEQTAVRCADGLCEQAYRLPGTRVAFNLFVTPADRALLRTVPASLSGVPAGQTAVPYFDPGTDFAAVAVRLRSAGLRAVERRTGVRPATPVGSSPRPGTLVPVGSEVAVLVE